MSSAPHASPITTPEEHSPLGSGGGNRGPGDMQSDWLSVSGEEPSPSSSGGDCGQIKATAEPSPLSSGVDNRGPADTQSDLSFLAVWRDVCGQKATSEQHSTMSSGGGPVDLQSAVSELGS